MKKISHSEYSQLENEYAGFCTVCTEFTHESCEPDAEGYTCPQCDSKTCYGMMTSLFEGFIEIADDSECE